MPLLTADGSTQQIPAGPCLLVNTDTARSVYIGPQRPVTTADAALPPQASVSLDGSVPWYISTLDQSVVVKCAVLPGGLGWSDPVGVQITLNTLGLALDATVAALPGRLQAMGIPPFIPNAQPFGAVDLGGGGSPHLIVPAQAADAFIWYAHLSLTMSSNASHVGNDQSYAMLRTASGKPLLPCQASAGGADCADSDSAQLTIGGVRLAAGDTVVVDCNNGHDVTNCEFRAGCVVILGTPP